VHILLTNDDGVYAPGLRALRRQLQRLGDVTVVAPLAEQSGVGHSITLLTPLIVQEVFEDEQRVGWLVEGSPADCVKLACLELLDAPPDLVVSGLNLGANVGINVLYSGTVAAAVEGAFFGHRSIAVSLEFSEHPNFDRAAALAVHVIKQILRHEPPEALLFNVNLPQLEAGDPLGVRVVPQGVVRYREGFERRVDPRGRIYFWAKVEYRPDPHEGPTDIASLAERYITVTPLYFDLTHRSTLQQMADWNWKTVGVSPP
jgi:5'-nucleotidase